ncbi:bacteriocin immunity protein [Pseudomonas entomophila]|uniref:bacteriocin immunity protein n=1 Tax=Pseudomonas entomophila TaxID=312306 RepID=UPI0023D8B248|nr:bacteriocin immunity protein [Pseudomonas entomophila]MDF0731973.1 bacteriocin immunity protein [Pseudomonas entomophila]
MKRLISDFTQAEFLEFATKIYNADYPTDQDHINAVFEFERIAEHPAKSDLFFYPEPGKDGPQAIVLEVIAWRTANGKAGFKAS